MALDLLFIVSGVLVTIYVYIQFAYSYWKRRNIPFLKPTFPYGNIKSLGREHHAFELMSDIYNKMKNVDKFCGIYMFTTPIALALDINFVKNILIKDFAYFQNRGIYFNEKHDPLGAHLFANEGDNWKRLRTKFSPAFSSGKMKIIFPSIMHVADQFNEALATNILQDGAIDVEIKDLLARFFIDVIGICVLGIDCNSIKEPNSNFRQFSKSIFEEPFRRRFTMFLANAYKSLARLLRFKIIPKHAEHFFLSIFNQAITFREKSNQKQNDFMDLLIEIKNVDQNSNSNNRSITMNELAAQAFVFFSAGFETSTTAVTLALYELAMNINIKNKARQHVKNIIEKHNGKFTYEAMTEMSYIDQIINESLRKYPPVGGLVRTASKDYKVPESKHIISKGTQIWIPVYAFHRDPEIFPNPEEFNPDRFSPNEINTAFTPFGIGPRHCIATRFAMMQMRVGLVTLLLNYDVSICSKTAIPPVFCKQLLFLSPENGVWLTLSKL